MGYFSNSTGSSVTKQLALHVHCTDDTQREWKEISHTSQGISPTHIYYIHYRPTPHSRAPISTLCLDGAMGESGISTSTLDIETEVRMALAQQPQHSAPYNNPAMVLSQPTTSSSHQCCLKPPIPPPPPPHHHHHHDVWRRCDIYPMRRQMMCPCFLEL